MFMHNFCPCYIKATDLTLYTVKPPKRDRIGDAMFGPCREVGPISEVFFIVYHHCIPPHNDRA